MSTSDDDLAPETRIYRHEQPVDDSSTGFGDPHLIEEVSTHIEAHVGPIQTVFHELVSSYVHIDVHQVLPSAAYPFHTLVTSGMSERPMTLPSGIPSDFGHAELVINLPSNWQLSDSAFADEQWYWPVRLLKIAARLPHEYATWLGFGHTVPNGDPPEPYAPTTKLSGVMIVPQLTLPEPLHRLTRSNGTLVRFWNLLPLYSAEMEFKLKKGTDALLERLDAAGASDIIDPERRSAVPSKGWWPF